MATGPEHYAEAERLLAEISLPDGTVSLDDGALAMLRAAQVHALLAMGADFEDWEPPTSPRQPRPTVTLPLPPLDAPGEGGEPS